MSVLKGWPLIKRVIKFGGNVGARDINEVSVKRSSTVTAYASASVCFITTQHAMACGNGNGKFPTNDVVWDSRDNENI